MGLTSTPFKIGRGQSGAKNLITDVPGVTVGHVTLRDGDRMCTGATAILPHGGDLFHDKVMAASCVFNGYGKTIGLVQVDELGTIESPIVLTNTLSVGTAATAVVRYMMEKNPEFVFELAVKGMIPNNVIGRSAMRRLRVYKGAEHKHAAQQPEVFNID